MKRIIFFILILSLPAFAGDTKYEDMPTTSTTELKLILDDYQKKARDTLGYFNNRFTNKKDKTFYVVTKLCEVNNCEQIFILIEKIEGDSYIGKIASTPLGKVKFQRGDNIRVNTANIVDWLIVNEDGTEEGNLMGKVIDLVQIGHAVFTSDIIPKDGKYLSFKVVSVINPYTRQEIIDIVPKEIIQKVEVTLGESIDKNSTEDNIKNHTKTIVRFPGWEIVDKVK